jgi:hypothetical protein
MIFSRSLLERTFEGRHEPVPAMRTPRLEEDERAVSDPDMDESGCGGTGS